MDNMLILWPLFVIKIPFSPVWISLPLKSQFMCMGKSPLVAPQFIVAML
jgi:hypothetical protein